VQVNEAAVLATAAFLHLLLFTTRQRLGLRPNIQPLPLRVAANRVLSSAASKRSESYAAAEVL
jgi:hypothetical protein